MSRRDQRKEDGGVRERSGKTASLQAVNYKRSASEV